MSKNIKRLRMLTPLEVAERWKEQYFTNGSWYERVKEGRDSRKLIYEALVAAADKPEMVDKIIGVKGWQTHNCNSCGESFGDGVEMLEPDYETTPTFCRACIIKAYELLEEDNA